MPRKLGIPAQDNMAAPDRACHHRECAPLIDWFVVWPQLVAENSLQPTAATLLSGNGPRSFGTANLLFA